MKASVSIFWFRRDLRLEDNAGLYHALQGDRPVLPVFIFDRNILDKLEDKTDRRVGFIHAAVEGMQVQLGQAGSGLEVYYGYPVAVFRQLLTAYQVDTVFTNHDYEPYAKERDMEVAGLPPIAKDGRQC
jgi:deoxyribodipyrimidine photo-lyase